MQENRKSPRKASLSRCHVSRLFSKESSMPSRVINYSGRGLMIELDHQLPPGETVAVQFGPNAAETALYGSSRCLGMVRWCARQEGTFGGFYGIGIELASHHAVKSL